MGGLFDIPTKLDDIKKLEEQVNQPDFWNDVKTANETNKKLSDLKKIVDSFNELDENINYYKEYFQIATDEELSQVEEDIKNLEEKISKLEINTLLGGEYDTCNCYLEIHPGAGGTESCDWASMLERMYQRYCANNDFTCEVLDEQKGDEAGIKSVTMHIKGNYAYGYLKCEKGVHRLVRISPFDSNARRHTSFASVSVIPEIDNNIDIEIKESDLKIDVYHSSGAGGQSVNTSNSAVRLTHMPTGIVVTCQNERSQVKNHEKALELLKMKIYDEVISKQEAEVTNERRSKIGTGDRSEKIRTYNYPQNRVTDHRIGFSIMELDRVMDGYLDPIIEALIAEDQRLKLEGSQNE